MKLRVSMALAIVLLFASTSGLARQHVHGQGQLLIAQQGKFWQLQLSLPAADALGFEHRPQTHQQQKKYQQLAMRLTENERIVILQPSCDLQRADTNMHADENDTEHEAHHEHEHEDEHEHEHDEHSQHDEHHSAHEDHQDLTANYVFLCHSEPNKVAITLFNDMPSLARIEVQWISDKGQGSQIVTPNEPILTF